MLRARANVTSGLIVFLLLGAVAAFVPVGHFQNPATTPPVAASSSTMPGGARCITPSASDVSLHSDIREIEAALYQAIVRLRVGDQHQTLVVESLTLPMPSLRVSNDLGLMVALPTDLKAPVRDGVTTCFEMTADRFPPGARLVPLAEIRQGARGWADWASVAARFDGARMWFAFSRALISADRRDAVVFYIRPCTTRCGEAEWVWFHRESPAAPWRVMKEVWSWIS